jgi:hypothetical protein
MPRKPTIKTVTLADGSRSVFNKNGNGEGTVYFQESKNAWRASYLLEGEAVRRYVQARTRDQVVVKRDQAILTASITSKSARFSTRTTVAEFGVWWLDNEARHRVRSSSLDQMQQRLTRLGSIGQRALGDVNVEDCRPRSAVPLQRLSLRLNPGGSGSGPAFGGVGDLE